MDEAIKARLDAIDAEDKRQNHRLNSLEVELKDIREIASSIKELTLEIKHLREDVQAQNIRLSKIESAPIEKITVTRNATISAIINVFIGTLVGGMLMMIIQYVK